jgi:hypothetical protein
MQQTRFIPSKVKQQIGAPTQAAPFRIAHSSRLNLAVAAGSRLGPAWHGNEATAAGAAGTRAVQRVRVFGLVAAASCPQHSLSGTTLYSPVHTGVASVSAEEVVPPHTVVISKAAAPHHPQRKSQAPCPLCAPAPRAAPPPPSQPPPHRPPPPPTRRKTPLPTAPCRSCTATLSTEST